MRTEPSAHKICEFIVCVKNLLHVLAMYREVLHKGCVAKTIQPMHKYKTLNFKYMVLNTLKYKIQIKLFVLNVLVLCVL